MQTMTSERKTEAGEVEKIIGETAKPKSDPKLAVPKECYWHELFRENPSSMQQGSIEDFIRQYGCEGCEGYGAQCKGRA